MVLTAKMLSQEIRKGNDGSSEGIAVIPEPDLSALENGGEASVSLRLGRWFVSMRQTNETVISPIPEDNAKINKVSKQHFVPFGREFVLHPNRFVLASTLEWIRLPRCYAAFVVGKSKLGRRGIIIENGGGHSSWVLRVFDLGNSKRGGNPGSLISGMMIGQLFVHRLEGSLGIAKSKLAVQRKPRLGEIEEDEILAKLKETSL